MEFSGTAQLGAQAAFAARAPLQKPPEVLRVDANDASERAGADPRQLSQNAANAATLRNSEAQDFLPKNPDKPAGPPPSFDISLLEMEQDLKEVLARIEISRSQERDAEGVRTAPDTGDGGGDMPAGEAATAGTPPDKAASDDAGTGHASTPGTGQAGSGYVSTGNVGLVDNGSHPAQ